MNISDYKTFGRSGLKISPITLGTMTFGNDSGWGCEPKIAEEILDYYINLGGNSIDTANGYTNGHSEKIIGDYLRKYINRRDELVISTKFFTNLYPKDPNAGGTSRKSIMQSLDNSLRRLQSEYIDIYWIHSYEPFVPIEETMQTLDSIVKSGKVRYIGISDTPAWKIAQMQMYARQYNLTPIIGNQVEYSLLERTVEGDQFQMGNEMGIGAMTWSPLKGGILSGKYTRDNKDQEISARTKGIVISEQTYNLIDELSKIAKDKDTSVANVALAWVLGKKEVTSVIFGVTKMSQLKRNLEVLNINLTNDEMNILDSITTPSLDFPHELLKSSSSLAYGSTNVNGIKPLDLKQFKNNGEPY